jgi:hypothetical protein
LVGVEAAHILVVADLAAVRILVVAHGISAAAAVSAVAAGRVFTLAVPASHRSGRARP